MSTNPNPSPCPHPSLCSNCSGTGGLCRRCGIALQYDEPPGFCNGGSGSKHEFVECPDCNGSGVEVRQGARP